MLVRIATPFLLACVVFSGTLFGQTAASDSIALKYVHSIKEADLKKHLEVIASDEYEGRETGKKGQKLAAEYLAKEFKKLGLKQPFEDGYYQNFPLIEQKAGGINLTINDKELSWKKDFYAFPKLLKKDEMSRIELAFGGYGEIDMLKTLDVKGKAVLLLSKSAKLSMKETVAYLKKEGAKAALLVDEGFEEHVEQWDHYLDKESVKLAKEDAYDTFPVLYLKSDVVASLLGKSTKKLKKLAAKSKSLPLEVSCNIKIDKETTVISTENVLGIIEGTEKKEEVIVITAHYDHLGKRGDVVFNGADDDGSGTVALLELAEAFTMAKQNGNGCKRSILFMAVSGEEKGLLGSAYYVQHPVFPLSQTMANLNIDMIGRHDEQHDSTDRYIYVIGADKISTQLHTINEAGNALLPQLELDYKFNDEKDPNRFYYRSDHYNFAKNDVPVIFYFSGVHVDYHKSTDTIEKIAFNHLKDRSQLVFLTAWKLANRNEMLEKNKP
jgi:hypothetical protein